MTGFEEKCERKNNTAVPSVIAVRVQLAV